MSAVGLARRGSGSGTGHEETERQRARRLARSAKAIKDPAIDRVVMVVVYILLATFLAAVLIPLLYILASSFSDPDAVSAGQVVLWPVGFTLEGYTAALGESHVATGFLNSLIYTVGGTFISLVLTIAIAYPLSRSDFVGRRVITGGIVFTMLFSGGLIPTYLVVQSLGLLNTRWALLLPAAIGVWQVIIATTFFRVSIPDGLIEAAELDGASDLRILWSIVLPLAKPVIAVIALMYAIGQWNAYFDALIYLRDDSLYPLPLVLRNILILNSNSQAASVADQLAHQHLANLLKYSLVVVSTVPVMLVYPLVARYFTKGILIGAVKG